MKTVRKLLTITALIAITTSCSNLPIESKAKEGFATIENYNKDLNSYKRTEIYVMCRNQVPIKSNISTQYYADGEQSIWVRVYTNEEQTNGKFHAYMKFNVTIESDKRYFFDYKIQNENISIWLKNREDGTIISESLNSPLYKDFFLTKQGMKKVCSSSTV